MTANLTPPSGDVRCFDLWPNNDKSGASSLYPFLTVRAEKDRIEITQTDPRQVVRLTPWMADWLLDALLQIRPIPPCQTPS